MSRLHHLFQAQFKGQNLLKIRVEGKTGKMEGNLAIAPLVIWAAMTVSIFAQSSSGGAAEMVVVADEAIGYSADSTGSPPRFSAPLPGGVEVRLIEDRNGWSHVRLADGRDAWLRRATLRAVR